MTAEQFHDALTLLPEDLVTRADEFRSRKPRIIPWKRYAALAASFAVLLTSAVIVHTLRQKAATSKMAAAAPYSAMYDTGAADEAPRMEAAMGTPEASGSAAMADCATAFTCVETPANPHSTASYAHGPSPVILTSRSELDAYFTKWEGLYLLDALRDACAIYDKGWFPAHDLLLIPVEGVTGPCIVTDLTIANGACEITVALSSEKTEEPTHYHIVLPVEKGAVTDPQNITVIYNSDTNG